jgi:hypothetical protein
LFYENWLRRELGGPLGASPPRGVPPALGEGIAGTAASKGLRREFPLGEAFNERKSPFAERNLALGEGLESGSDYLTVCWEYNMKTN